MKYLNAFFGLLLFVSLIACKDDDVQNPNELGGDGNIVQNEVGSTWSVYPEILNSSISGLGVKSSVKVIKSNNGIIEVKAGLTFNEKDFRILDSLLGLKGQPDDAKKLILDSYKNEYGFTLDTTDKKNMKLDFTIKAKSTTEGIQDFIGSKGDESKPFTLVKYSDNVGQKYEFTDANGKKTTRTIVYKDTDNNSYQYVMMNIKVTKVEEIKEDPFISKITYYTNHKFGLVDVYFEFKNGKKANISLVPDNIPLW